MVKCFMMFLKSHENILNSANLLIYMVSNHLMMASVITTVIIIFPRTDLAASQTPSEVKENTKRFSLTNNILDTEYLELAKNPQKNEAKLQEIIDEEAVKWGCDVDENGKLTKFYHGTDNFGFSQLDVISVINIRN